MFTALDFVLESSGLGFLYSSFRSMNCSFSVIELKTKREEEREAELKTETGRNGSVNLYNIA